MVPASAGGPAAEAAAMPVKSKLVMVHHLQARWGTHFIVERPADIFTEKKVVGMEQIARIAISAGLLKDPRGILCSASRRASTTSRPRDAGMDHLASVAISALGRGRQI